MATQERRVLTAPLQVKFKKKADDPAQSGTMSALMRDKTVPRRSVRVPLVTLAAGVKFEKIFLNHFTFEPGKEYDLPLEVADELEAAIRRFEDVPLQQMTGNVRQLQAIEIERSHDAAFRDRQRQNAVAQLAHA